MFYCYMNDENYEPIINVLFDQKLWSTLQHILHVLPRIVLPISLKVDHDLWSTLHALYGATFICTHLCW